MAVFYMTNAINNSAKYYPIKMDSGNNLMQKKSDSSLIKNGLRDAGNSSIFFSTEDATELRVSATTEYNKLAGKLQSTGYVDKKKEKFLILSRKAEKIINNHVRNDRKLKDKVATKMHGNNSNNIGCLNLKNKIIKNNKKMQRDLKRIDCKMNNIIDVGKALRLVHSFQSNPNIIDESSASYHSEQLMLNLKSNLDKLLTSTSIFCDIADVRLIISTYPSLISLADEYNAHQEKLAQARKEIGNNKKKIEERDAKIKQLNNDKIQVNGGILNARKNINIADEAKKYISSEIEKHEEEKTKLATDNEGLCNNLIKEMYKNVCKIDELQTSIGMTPAVSPSELFKQLEPREQLQLFKQLEPIERSELFKRLEPIERSELFKQLESIERSELFKHLERLVKQLERLGQLAPNIIDESSASYHSEQFMLILKSNLDKLLTSTFIFCDIADIRLIISTYPSLISLADEYNVHQEKLAQARKEIANNNIKIGERYAKIKQLNNDKIQVNDDILNASKNNNIANEANEANEENEANEANEAKKYISSVIEKYISSKIEKHEEENTKLTTDNEGLCNNKRALIKEMYNNVCKMDELQTSIGMTPAVSLSELFQQLEPREQLQLFKQLEPIERSKLFKRLERRGQLALWKQLRANMPVQF